MAQPEYDSLAEALKGWRREHGYTTNEASRVSGLTRNSIQRLEAGSYPNAANLVKLSKIFRMTPGQVIDTFNVAKKEQ